jgi:aminopeptidase
MMESRMTRNIEELKKDYADLLIRSGLNLRKGQRLAISCPVECADFARLCAAAAYEAGCREVIMSWNDDALTRLKYLHAEDDVFDSVNPWEKDFRDIISEEGAGWLAIYAEDPENLKGVDPDRISRAQKAHGKAMAKFRQREMRSEFPWCVCSVPTDAWSNAVFPDMDNEEAKARLWEEILAACRVDGGDAVQNWKDHSDELQRHVQILNEYNFRELRYKNSAGTDVTVELPEGHFWAGGEEKGADGRPFSANIPTEEVFTLPKRDSINGTIVATKPLAHNGTLIEGFRFEVKDGKIVDVHAEKGETILRDAISVDEGASYFGEVALVPHDSPISKSGILFMNTLFDENASCHFAFGEAYPNIYGAENMSEEELKERGANFSMTHVDFMVGSADLTITGITHDGEEVPVFVNGNFAF